MAKLLLLLLFWILMIFGESLADPKNHQSLPKMKILALFSTTKKELGLDHRLGRQVLKLASQKVAQIHPELTNQLEVSVENNDFECSSSNEMPNKVVELYYSKHSFEECKRESLQNCSEQEIDSKQLDKLLSSFASSSNGKKRWTRQAEASGLLNGSIDAILGPSCHYLVDLIARTAAYWRVPIYSVASISAQFADKSIYPTLTRLSPSIDQLSLFMMKTMQKFKWIHLAILIDFDQIENKLILENLEQTIIRQSHQQHRNRPIEKPHVFGLSSGEISIVSDRHKMNSIQNETNTEIMSKCTHKTKEILMRVRSVARVVLLLINNQQTIRQLLLCAHEIGFQHAGFTFLALDLGLKSADIQSQSSQSRSSQKLPAGQTAGFDWYLADDEENNSIAKQMFESLMVFSVEMPISDEYNLFVEQTLDLANQQYPQIRFDRSAVNSLAVALHDSLLLAVEAHLKHYFGGASATSNNNNKTSDNGAEDIQGKVPLMWGEQVTSSSSASSGSRIRGLISKSLHINSNGDQELDYVLSDLEPELGQMRPVAVFSKELRQIELLPDTFIDWPKRLNTLTRELIDTDQVPPDEPECGFDDQAEHCVDRQNLYAILTILACLIGLLALGSMFSLYKYRNIKYQMQLDDYWWKINWDDLQFLQMGDGSMTSNAQSVARALKSGASVVSAGSDGATSFVSVMRPKGHHRAAPSMIGGPKSQVDQMTHIQVPNKRRRRQAVPLIVTSKTEISGDDGGGQVHTEDGKSAVTAAPSGSLLAASSMLIRSEYSSVVRASNLALYKDELVIVKQLNADTINMSRELLVELKSIRELVNDNLARFIGLCLDPNRLAIVYEFCSRGSLQDLILNKDVAMDLTLKYSIIGDIVNGLSFIHTTLLDYHGRLKSTNLVLDGRFTVKITDFGLQGLYSQLDMIQDQAQDEDLESGGADDDDNLQAHQQQPDQISLSVSQAAYNMDSVSVVGARNPNRHLGSRAGTSIYYSSRVKLRNRGAARFFWTAPEHLREKNSHFLGSKRGDIYSFAIILSELLTRREPYYYGTNAQPCWHRINQDKRLFRQQDTSGAGEKVSSAGSRLLSSVSRHSRRASKQHQLGSEVRLSASQAGRRLKRNSVSPASFEPDAISVISDHSAISQASSSSRRHRKQPLERHHHQTTVAVRVSVSGVDENKNHEAKEEQVDVEEQERDDEIGRSRVDKKKPLDAEEILDQLRMGIQPEPVRPYIPNYVSQGMSSKLIDLVRACWSELPQSRPPLNQVRTQLRKISRGLASRNYLDNLLDRLQNYAADLERIVDLKSADIMGEQLRTEELLYQLVPKFVAERLKRSEPIVPQVFDGVTIFFSDIVGFEKYASVMSPIELVDLLNSVYSSFDSIISSFDVTKIETIIDQFLVASGISFTEHQTPDAIAAKAATGPTHKEDDKEEQRAVEEASNKKGGQRRGKLSKRIGLLGSLGKGSSHSSSQDQGGPTNRNDSLDQQQQSQQQHQHMAPDSSYYRRSSAEQIGRMALCIRDLVKSFRFRQNISQQQNQQQTPLAGSTFNIRIGIHSGKVCAGIVGLKRPKFCLIGDTVNVASRMHTNSKANRIQISDDTRQLLEQVPGFSIEPRGKIEVKGKGLMETFWLESSY